MKILLHEPLRLCVAQLILKTINSIKTNKTTELSAELVALDTANLTIEDIYRSLVEPPQTELGHLAYGCFILAKQLKKSPAVVAQALLRSLQASLQEKAEPFTVSAAGPYLNFVFTAEYLAQSVLVPLLDGTTFHSVLSDSAPRTMLEFSQPNTHKEIHVGHMRNLCLGDALVRLMRRTYGQDKIISATFPGDVGTHVAKCLWYLKNFISESEFQSQLQNPLRGEWLGRIYSNASLKLEDEEKTPSYEKNKQQLTEILKQLESGQGEFFELWKTTREWSIELMKKVYQWADVSFDQWYWESDVDAASVKTIKKYFAEGKLQQSQGAIGLDFSEEGLGFCLLLKSDGTGLYATKDIELARRKFEDYHIEKSIYVVDVRQALHFKQVFRALEVLGFSQAKNCFHLQYNFVELPDGPMSSRKGNIVPLFTLVEAMQNHVKKEYLSRYSQEWSEGEINQVANTVAIGAIRYGMLRQDTNKKIVFDQNEWLKLDGESGPFIQYSFARINSLLKKFGPVQMNFEKNLLSHASELRLLQHLMNFNTAVVLAAENYRPSSLCSYLYEASKKFNAFYHDCSIGQAENEQLKASRLALAAATGEVLRYGLSLLGIPVPERM